MGEECCPNFRVNASQERETLLSLTDRWNLDSFFIVPEFLRFLEADPVLLLIFQILTGIEFELHRYKNYTLSETKSRRVLLPQLGHVSFIFLSRTVYSSKNFAGACPMDLFSLLPTNGFQASKLASIDPASTSTSIDPAPTAAVDPTSSTTASATI